MPIRLNPDLSDPESDLETQLLAMGAIVAGNLMTVALLRNKLQRHRDATIPLSPIYDKLPKASTALFGGASLYFLSLSHRDIRQAPQRATLWLVFGANVLSTLAVALKTHVVFSAPPESEATIGSLEP